MYTEKLLTCTNKLGKIVQLRKVEESGEVCFIIDSPNGQTTEQDFQYALDIFKDELSILVQS